VTEPLNGLRFDIYERINLPEQAAAIGELEEIELVPRMQALNEEDQVLLKGHLLLSGIYRAEGEQPGTSRLEHRIPVEISLPHSRVARLDELSVEIDNFDVDLLSARSLNVTGVLTLRGLQNPDAESAPIWRDDSFTVVHQARAESTDVPELRSSDPSFGQPQAEESGLETSPVSAEEASAVGDAARFDPAPASDGRVYGKEVSPAFDDRLPESLPPVDPADAEPPASFAPQDWRPEIGWGDIPVRSDASESDGGDSRDAAEFFADEPPSVARDNTTALDAGSPHDGPAAIEERTPAPDAAAAPLAESAPDKTEMKVALGGKPLDASERAPSGVGLLSMLGEKGAAKEALLKETRSAKEEEEKGQREASRASTGDELEWTKLFLSKGSESQEFSKVRICIVQREETLDSIAARYNVQTRELQLRNRLTDPYVSEGQVLYIP